MKVVKFGGSSVASADKFKMVKDIVFDDDERDVVVVSAPGKIGDGDNKVTDLLYICYAHIKYKVDFDDIWAKIYEKYMNINNGLGLSGKIAERLLEAKNMLKKESEEEVVSRGEYLCAVLMAEYLGYHFVDSTEWLFFNYDGTVDYEKSYSSVRALYKKYRKMVIPGFYGVMPDGKIHTFSRGGSDVTGALLAEGLSASVYENWTDVSGILMADPKIVDKPKTIERVTFNELRELSYMGAEVLHEETVFPVRRANIPLCIKNTNRPEDPGTLIMESFEEESEDEKKRFITGITGKKHYSMITISKVRMSDDVSFLRRVLELTEKYRLNVEHIPSGVDSLSLVIKSNELEKVLPLLLADIHDSCSPDTVKVTDKASLIAVVGRKMAFTAGVSGKIFETLGHAGVNIRMIEQGADEINITVGVSDADFKKSIRTLYDSFT